MSNSRFWETLPMQDWTRSQWESLCDHCARCCLHKIEDIDSREIYFTNVCCRYLDQQQCQCTRYRERSELVPDCVTLTPADLDDPYWLPDTCAYRLVAEGKPLPNWHPLLSGDQASVTEAAISVGGRVISELEADDLEQHLVTWVKA